MSDNQQPQQQPKQIQKQQQPSHLEYKLNKILNESTQKEEEYISFIKQQQEKLFEVTERYNEVLTTYKRDIRAYIDNKQKEAMKKREHYERVINMGKYKPPPNKYSKEQYTKLTQNIQLECGIKFMYITPVVTDYLREKYPERLTIKFKIYYPQRKQITMEANIDDELEPDELINNLINGYPFQLYTKQKLHPFHKFHINHNHPQFEERKILNYYHNEQMQIDLFSTQSGLLYCSGKANLQQFLFYSNEEEQWMEKIPLYSSALNEPKIMAYLHVQFSTKSIQKPIAVHIHKVSEPLSLNRPNINDKQSRLLQRISTYKSSQQSIIPAHHPQQTIDTNILLHRKKLQLEQIENYKQKHKMQYMDKVIDEAMEQFKTTYVQLGQCKYVLFYYTNEGNASTVQRLSIEKNLKQINGEGQMDNILVQVLQPQTIHKLIKTEIIQSSSYATVDYSYDDDMIMIAKGQTIMIVVKFIVNKGDLTDTYNLTVSLANEYQQVVHEDTILLKVIEPIPINKFTLYCESNVKEQISIHTPELRRELGKKKAVFIKLLKKTQIQVEDEFQYIWNDDILELKIKNKKLLIGSMQGTKPNPITAYLHIYDVNYMTRIAVFELNILPCMKVDGLQPLHLGIVQSFNLTMKTMPEVSQTLAEIGSSDVTGAQCSVSCLGKQQLILQPNHQYPIQIRYQSFTHSPNPQKLVIQCVNSTTREVLYRWLLRIPKVTVSYKHIYRLICPIGKTITFPYELVNTDTQNQHEYRIYSSNHSVIKVPTEKLVLFGGQTTKIELQIECWEGYVKALEEEGRGGSVVMGVDDGKTVLLYLFELEIEDG